MKEFSLLEIAEVKGKFKFWKLKKRNKCEFDEFEIDARRNYDSEMNSVYHKIDRLSRGHKLPQNQFRILKGGLKGITECEIKTKNLRIYYFVDGDSGNIIVTGGYKKTQKKDISHFRNLVKEYLDFKKGEMK